MIHRAAFVESLRIVATPIACLGILLSAFGCGAGNEYRPGDSDVPLAAANRPHSTAAPPRVRWEHLDQVATMTVIVDTAPSRGHVVGALNARIIGNTQASSALDALRPGDAMPVGAILVAQHTSRARGTAEGVFAMIKREEGYFPAGGDWEWVAVGADGNVQSRGKLETCARCHADAAVDFVFPRPAPPAAAEPGP